MLYPVALLFCNITYSKQDLHPGMPDQKSSIFLGAAVVALLSTSYLSLINYLCCLGVIVGAMTTIWHYTSTYRLTVEMGRGAVLGLAAAALGAFVAIFLNYLLSPLGLDAGTITAELTMNMFRDMMPPEQLEQLQSQMDQQQGAGLMQRLFSGLFGVVIASVFGAIGGIIGASVFKKGGAPDEPSSEIPERER